MSVRHNEAPAASAGDVLTNYRDIGATRADSPVADEMSLMATLV
jgi:hypothetical protein